MGWALKSTQSHRTKLIVTKNQKQYVDTKFQTEERTGKKADPTEVSKAMRTAKDTNGERLFSYGNILTSQQISLDQPDSEDETPVEDVPSECT